MRCTTSRDRSYSGSWTSLSTTATYETGSFVTRTPSFHHPTHDLEWARKLQKQSVPPRQKPRRSASPESHRISSTRFWITSPPTQILIPSKHVLSYPNHGFNHASGTSSAPSSSLRGIWTDGSRHSQRQKRVPPTTSGIYASGSEAIVASVLISVSSTPRGLRTWIGCLCWGIQDFR